MKKIGSLVLVMCIGVYTASAQLYIRLGLGYVMPQAGQTFDGTGQAYSGSQTYTTYTQVYSVKPASFSTGMQGEVDLGYLFTEHIGVQLNAGLGLANKKYTFEVNNVSVSGLQSNVSIVQQAKSTIIMTPSLVLQTGGDPWNVYTRIGIALPLRTGIVQDQILSNLPGTGSLEVDDFTFNIKNSFSPGFSAAAGLQYKLNDKVSIWGEVSILSMSVYIKESDLTSVTSNGQGVSLSQVSGPQTIKYSKNAVIDSVGAQQPTYSQPFSNIGINVGVSFSLGQKRQAHRKSDEYIDDSKPFRRR